MKKGANYIYDGELGVEFFSFITEKKNKYGNGSIYEGEFLDNQRNGKGVYKYNNGNVIRVSLKKTKKMELVRWYTQTVKFMKVSGKMGSH